MRITIKTEEIELSHHQPERNVEEDGSYIKKVTTTENCYNNK